MLVSMTINEQYQAGKNATFGETQNLNSHNNQAKNIKGDGVYETSNSASSGTGSWFDACASFLDTSTPFFVRSGYSGYSNAGAFYFNSHNGNAYRSNSFRVVLVS